ncbi:MAG TPA: DUF6457 domain-containing protein [Acidimicrobiales bacterium]|jgi:hypothetical protein|nr:DUF6457 domain-containing protein [Acidimicrobiales bacterium]
MNDREWVREFAAAVGGREPTDEEFETLLALAGEAAHRSVRTAAPVACWVAGAAGVPLAEALETAKTIGG